MRALASGLMCGALLAALIATPVMAAPPNDEPTGATAIDSLPSSISVDLTGAAASPTDPSGCWYPGRYPSVWYSFTPTEDTRLTAGLRTYWVTLLWVFLQGPTGDLEQIGCTSQPSQPFVFDASAGRTYYFMVSSWNNDPTNRPVFNLAAPPANDSFGARTIIGSLPFSVTENTDGATLDPGDPYTWCGLGAWGSVWFEYTATSDTAVVTSLTGAAKGLTVYKGSPEDPQWFSCGIDTSPGAVKAGETLYIRIDTAGGELGFTLDYGPPTTTITSGPGIDPNFEFVNTTSVTWEFTAIAAPGPIFFECNFDYAGFAPCASPMTHSDLVVGFHVFQVRAVDSAGRVETYSKRAGIIVNLTLPTLNVLHPTGSGQYLTESEWTASSPPSCPSGIYGEASDDWMDGFKIAVSLVREGTGLYWSGVAFDSESEAFVQANGPWWVKWCLPFQFSNFPSSGFYVAHVRVRDIAGNDAFDTVRFAVGPDVVAPVIALPADIIVDGLTPAGAPADYEVTAEDDRDGRVPVACTPASGSTFPLGATEVNCSATDAARNLGSGVFTVIVKDANWQLVDVRSAIAAYGQSGSSLDDKIVTVMRLNTAAKIRQACDNLLAFDKSVQAQVGKSLTLDEAFDLITRSGRIRNVIGCPSR